MTDLDLLHDRLGAMAATWVPRVVDGVHVGPELTADLLATTRRGWDIETGQPALLRFLRPAWRGDPALHRRFAAIGDAPAHPLVVPPALRLDGAHPHVRWTLPGPLAEDLLWADEIDEGPPDAVAVARLAAERVRLGQALRSIGAPPRVGRGFVVVQAAAGARVVWLDRFDAPGTEADEVAALTADVLEMDPTGETAAGALVAAWHTPARVLTADDAARALVTTLRDALLDQRHGLVRQHRMSTEGSRAARLRRSVRRLAAALPPPVTHARLPDGLWLWSDGATVRGGPSGTGSPAGLARVWTRRDGVDPVASRTLLRAARQHGADPDAAPLVRWLAGQARLRRADRLLRAWSVGSISR